MFLPKVFQLKQIYSSMKAFLDISTIQNPFRHGFPWSACYYMHSIQTQTDCCRFLQQVSAVAASMVVDYRTHFHTVCVHFGDPCIDF